MIHSFAYRHGAGRTELRIGAGALTAGPELGDWVAGRQLFVVSSPRLLELHGHRIEETLARAATRIDLAVPEGEAAKRLSVAEELWRRMLREGGKRDARLVAFGGGSVGDLGGFVAGAFLRGIRIAQLPTTLLAQVDASVGGKTAIDLPEAKNTVGLFHHPDLVIADTSLLSTLPVGELRSGLVEVVKMAALLDPPLLERVEAELQNLLRGDAAQLAQVVAGAVAAKARVVEEDPEEGDRRRVLNFGHTLGHAIEASLGYAGLRHGEAVAYGLLFALLLAERRGWAADLAPRLRRLLSRFGLPPLPDLEVEPLLSAMSRDKKARQDGLVWVLPEALGRDRMVRVETREVAAALPAFLAEPWSGS